MVTAPPARRPLGPALFLAVALTVAAGCSGTDSPATDSDTGSNGTHSGAGASGEKAPPAASDHAGTNGSGSNGGVMVDPEDLAGIEVYHAQYCGTCHRSRIAGTTGAFGPPHDSLRATAERRIRDPGYSGAATTAEEYIRESVLQPAAYRAPGFEHTRFQMPAYTHLSEADVNALVRMLLRDPPTDGG